MSTAARLTTADELFRMPEDGYRYDLVEGELRKMTPAGAEHGFLSSTIDWLLRDYVKRNDLGAVFGAETGFRIARNPDTVLAPDCSFVRKERIAAIGIPKEFYPEAPALVVEIVSPSDSAEEVDDKMQRWLLAGVEMGWVVFPRRRTVTVYRGLDDIEVLSSDGILDGISVLPGFRYRVGDLFSGLST